MPIPDPEIVWKAGQEKLKKQFPLQLDKQDEEEGVRTIVDFIDDESLQQNQHDYIIFPESSEEDSSCSEELEESEFSNYSVS